MKTMTYSESRARYAEVLNAVTDDREEIVITRAGHEPVVIVSLEDYQSLKETAYLLRSPANARRLLASIEELESGGGTVRELTCGGRPRTAKSSGGSTHSSRISRATATRASANRSRSSTASRATGRVGSMTSTA